MSSKRILTCIRKSKITKSVAFMLLFEMIFQLINPMALYALTSGPTQPEVDGFQPIGMSDMVDPFTGDFSYNIPLLEVGGYPLNLAYQSGVGMDDEASWTGLGWNVHTGAITRQMRGIPDDFWGDEITRRVYMRDNLTIGAKVLLGFETFGLDLSSMGLDLGIGVDVSYNTYRGVALGTSTSVGIGMEGAGLPMNLGLSMSSGPEGLNISPNISFTAKMGSKTADAQGSASLGFGFNINSRAGLSGMSLNHSHSLKGNEKVKLKIFSFIIKVPTGKSTSISNGGSSSISLGQPTFTPQIDLPMINSAGSGRFKLGAGVFGQDLDATIVGYGSKQKLAKNTLINPSFGYMYSEKASGNPEAVHDFNREKDGSFTKEKKNLPVTNYTHDIFSISAQGLAGTYRAYRNDAGFVYDKKAFSPSTSIDFGLELAPGQLIDWGLDFSANVLESESKAWTSSNAAAEKLKFRGKQINDIKENFHLKLSGEKNTNSDLSYFNSLRGNKPVRFDLDTDGSNFEVPAYNKFVEANGSKHTFSEPHRSNRQPRNTAIYQFTKKEVLAASPWKAKYISAHAKDHHIAEIVVVQPDGKRYVFSLAAYNSKQVEYSFNVGVGNVGSDPSLVSSGNANSGIVNGITGADLSPGTKKRGIDHFYDETTTPAYAHSWMLTEVLSADYVDLTGNGPSQDDLGTYTKFNYGKIVSGNLVPDIQNFKWRTPITGSSSASYMEGLKTDKTDDKANIIYGEKDIWYLHSIESKTQIALFVTSDRNDGLGANVTGTVQTDKRLQKLDKIILYSKQEYDYDPLTAVPIKTVHFEYDYSLCRGTPNSDASGSGKLTLKKVFFTYKNSNAGRYSPYEFNYRTHSEAGSEFIYKYGEVDRWNTYKPVSQLPAGSGLTKSEYPYSVQDKGIRDDYSSAWHLDEIDLPSGGKIKVEYESDDYAFVQNKDAMRMFNVLGLAAAPDMGYTDGRIYTSPLNVASMRDYLIVQLDQPVSNDTEFRTKYLSGYGKGNHGNNPLEQLYFRCLINVNPGLGSPEYEFVSGYAKIDGVNNCGLLSPGSDKAYIKIKPVQTKISGVMSDVSPFAFAAWQFSRLYTPRKAYSQPEPTDPAIEQFIQTLAAADMFAQLIQFFQGPNGRMMAQGFGSKIDTKGSWVRLMEPDKNKLGGGNRVKEILISDEWESISETEAGANYGQQFAYTTDEGYSSGVAAYEPGVGADENPFRMPKFYNGPKQILIPEERYYLEEPFGESFFPSPSIGYSKVTVKDKVFDNNVTLNRTGKTVHEFYTAFDFPTIPQETPIEIQPRKSSVLAQLLKINARNYMTASQGYTVHLNDMHGKPKSQSMFAEGETSPFAYTKYHYKTNSDGSLNNMAEVINSEGLVETRQIGVETDFIADMRQHGTTGETISMTANLATMLFGTFPVSIFSIFGSYAKDRTRFRSAVTTKVVYSFGLQDRTETYDKGAYVETRITAYDGMTGEPIAQELNNEFKDKYHKIDYPAHWAYTGMGQASQNIGYTFSYSGTGPLDDPQHVYLEPGDEVLPLGPKPYLRPGSGYTPSNANTAKFWVSLQESTGEKFLIDHLGRKYFPGSATLHFTVIRSGHRNMQSTSLGSVTSVLSPLKVVSGQKKVVIESASKVIAASAVEFSEHWKTLRSIPAYQQGGAVTINYDPQILALIGIFNNVIDSNSSLITSDLNYDIYASSQSQFEVLFPGCETPPVEFGAFPSLSSGQNCRPPGWASWGGLDILDSTLTYPSLVFYLNHQYSSVDCNCIRMTLWNMSPCPEGSISDWDNIAYFKDECTVYDSEGIAFGVAESGNTYGRYVMLTAVMEDNTEQHFLLFYGCWDAENEIIVTGDTYKCIAAGDTVNPYILGILGNWRAQGDYFFMGDRNNTNASTAENLRTDGYISNFITYWQTPVSSTEVWKVNTAVDLGKYENWNWKTRMTIYSPFGYDLENMNPLPAYSSAQYGYQNTLPVAVANNAQQKEIGYDGFEDYYPWIPKSICEAGHFKFEPYESDISFTQSHTGFCSMGIDNGEALTKTFPITVPYTAPQSRTVPYILEENDVLSGFSPNLGTAKRYVLSFWAKTETRSHTVFDYTGIDAEVKINGASILTSGSLKKSKLIADWQRYELTFDLPASPSEEELEISISNTNGQKIYVDDIRVHPFDANIKTFVYHMYDMRYMAQLDENNFATFYEYDEEGKLVRVKKETERGIMTLQENRTNMYKR